MDISTKFDVGDTVLFMMAEKNNLVDIKIVEATVQSIDISIESGGGGHIITYEVKDSRNTMELPEKYLCRNHKELVEYIFRSKNVRTFTSKDHKISKSKDPMDDFAAIFSDLIGSDTPDRAAPYIESWDIERGV